MLTYSDLSRVHIELTTKCNARCPMCMRNYRGVDYNSGYPLTELTIDQIKQIFTADVLVKLTRGVNFNGNLGDFGVAQDAKEIVEFFVLNKVPVSICTNGSMRQPGWWASLAHPGVTIGFALDGLKGTHELYRLDTNWDRVIENATAFISAGGNATWRMVLFDHNKHQVEECKELSKKMGFADFEILLGGRDRGPVFNRDRTFSHHIGEPYAGDVNLDGMLESHIKWSNARSSHKSDNTPLNLRCTHMLNKEVYLAADGTVYPCCFLGFYPATMNHHGNKQTKQIALNNNALEHGLEGAMNWFTHVYESWQKQSIREGRLLTCVETCHQEIPRDDK